MALFEIRTEIKNASNPEKALVLQRFFKTGKGEYGEGDIFLGITVPQSRAIAKKYLSLSFSEIENLLASKIHEERLIALLILVENFKMAKHDEKRKRQTYEFYLRNTKHINNWDLVDLSSEKILGEFIYAKVAEQTTAHFGARMNATLDIQKSNKPRLERRGETQGLFDNGDKSVLRELARSQNIWEKRIAIVSTYAFIKKQRFGETLAIAEILLKDEHDLIHKAVGWMLREIGKRNQNVLEIFLQEHYREMPRTMLRYAIERFSEEKRKRYLDGEM